MRRVRPFCMALLLNGTFCFSWHFENDIDDFFCRWQQQLFSLKVGASGALFGLIGLLIVKLLQLRHEVRRPCCEVLCLLGVVLISFGKYNNNLQNKNTESLWIIPSSEKSLLESILLYTDFLALSVDHSFSLALWLTTAEMITECSKTQVSLQSFDHYCWKYLYVVTVHQ